jgi:hypothetical protein
MEMETEKRELLKAMKEMMANVDTNREETKPFRTR